MLPKGMEGSERQRLAGLGLGKGRAPAGVSRGQPSSQSEKSSRFSEKQQPALSLSLLKQRKGEVMCHGGKLLLNRIVRASPGGNSRAFNPGETGGASTAACEVDRGNSQRQKSSCLS